MIVGKDLEATVLDFLSKAKLLGEVNSTMDAALNSDRMTEF